MILELRNIEKSFGEKKVLTGVSFKAEGGKAFGLLGRNGAGCLTHGEKIGRRSMYTAERRLKRLSAKLLLF